MFMKTGLQERWDFASSVHQQCFEQLNRVIYTILQTALQKLKQLVECMQDICRIACRQRSVFFYVLTAADISMPCRVNL